MPSKINPNLNFDADFKRLNGENTFQPKPVSNTNWQNKAAFVHLNNALTDKTPEKPPLQLLKESLAKKPIDEKLKLKTIEVIVNPKKPSNKMTADDYDQAVWRAVFKKADYPMLSDGEIRQAVALMGSINQDIKSSGLDLANMRKSDAEPGLLTVKTDKYTIELAKRAGEAVWKNSQSEAERSAAEKEKTQSTINQMLIDPLKLGGNFPVRWAERILNIPRDLLQQIDKGEIMSGSSTAKWLGGKLGELITGQPAPKQPTISENIENLTGAKLPSIPEIELPRPFEYQTEKYKIDGKTGEDVGATAIDLIWIGRGSAGKLLSVNFRF